MSAAEELYLQLYDPYQILEGMNPDDPHDIDRRLVALRNLMQQLHGLFGELLRVAREQELHRQLGFTSFDAYCSQLGISKSKAYMLIGTDRSLRRAPLVFEAWRTGKLSLVQAAALSRVVCSSNEAEWIQIALSHPVAFLLRLVRYMVALDHSDPNLYGRLRGLPPREMVSGQVAFQELQMSALARAQRPAPTATASVGAGVPARPAQAPTATDSVGAGVPAAPTATNSVGAGVPARPRAEMAMSPALSWIPLEPAYEILTLRGPLWALEVIRDAILKLISASPAFLRPWEAFEALLDDFWATHGTLEKPEPKVLVRDDYHCQVPGCTCSRVEDHHIRFRSARGGSELSNRTAICPFHHRRGVHEGRIRLRGKAPDRLRWELRLEAGGAPFAVYQGQRRVFPRPPSVEEVREMLMR